MWSSVLSLIGGIDGIMKLIPWVAGAVGGAIAAFMARRSGMKKVELETTQKHLEDVRKARAVDDGIDGMSDEELRKLEEKWVR